jgi:probable phosphoglycerate mutase
VTVFCLVRHGAYPLLDRALGGRADHALNQAGLAQAAHAARVIAARPIAHLASSPVARAMQTAEPIAAALGLAVNIEPGFAEIDFAAWTGMEFTALAELPAWRAWNEFRGSAGVPGGESMLAVQARAMAAILRLHAAFHAAWPEGEVVVVSHADVIKAILAHVLGSPLDLLRRLQIDPGSMSRFAFGDRDARVLEVNLRS